MSKLRCLVVGVIITALTIIGTVPSFTLSSEDYTKNNLGNEITNEEINSEEIDSKVDREALKVEPKLKAKSAILINGNSGEIIYEKNPTKQRDPASMTKILNCLVVLDKLDLEQEVTITHKPEKEGSVMGLKKGMTFKVEDLVYAMMVWSANDAAEALAYEAGGDIDTFCSMMNEKAVECGAKNTNMVNPNGLNPNPDGKNNLTTAEDMALIVKAAMDNEEFVNIVGTEKLTVESLDGKYKMKDSNSNLCLWDKKTKTKVDSIYIDGQDGTTRVAMKYDGCIGVKTGYSSMAGDCFAGYVRRVNTEFISVVMHSSSTEMRFTDSINLWNYAFANYESYTLAEQGVALDDIKIKRGTISRADIGIDKDLKVTTNKGEQRPVYTRIELDQNYLRAPVSEGTKVGRIVAYEDGKAIDERPLYVMENVGKGGPLSYIGIADEYLPHFFICVGVGLAALITIVVIRVSRRKRETE